MTIVLYVAFNYIGVNVSCLCLFSVIRAKVVGKQEIEVGNNIYGYSVTQIKYDIKQLKVHFHIYKYISCLKCHFVPATNLILI